MVDLEPGLLARACGGADSEKATLQRLRTKLDLASTDTYYRFWGCLQANAPNKPDMQIEWREKAELLRKCEDQELGGVARMMKSTGKFL